MERFKGTAGPWRIASSKKAIQFFVIHGKDLSDVKPREIQVVKIDYGPHPIKEQLDMTHANARLIAAAPDLLQAAIAMTNYCNKHNIEQLTPVHEMLTDAIKKALGK